MSKSLNIPAAPSNHIPRKNPVTYFLGVLVLKLLGWRFRGNLPAENQYIMAVAPHTSNWDFVIGLAGYFCMRVKMSFMMKSTGFFWPFGGMLKSFGGIPIDRSKSHGVVEQMVDKFNEKKGLIIAIAPEGTRRRVEKWKTGFLHMAQQAKIPVQLVGLDYRTKEIILGPTITVTQDIEAALQKAKAFYANMLPKYPENCVTSN